MVTKKDIIPSSDSDFDQLQQNVISMSTTNQMAWNIDITALTQVTTSQGQWTPKWNAAKNKNTRSRQDVLDKDAARAIFEPVLRNFLGRQIVTNSLISDGQRAAMGISPRDTHHSAIPKPIAIPVVDIQSGVGRSVVINFRTESDVPGKLKRGKPDGCAKVSIAFVINPEQPPVTPKDCNQFESIGKTTLRIEHDPDNAGKTAYFFCCYENPRGEKGPWSEVNSFDIP